MARILRDDDASMYPSPIASSSERDFLLPVLVFVRRRPPVVEMSSARGLWRRTAGERADTAWDLGIMRRIQYQDGQLVTCGSDLSKYTRAK
jgi:hypothetical protein